MKSSSKPAPATAGHHPSDATVFADFYASEFPGESRRAFLMLGDRDGAFDVVQASFVKVYERFDALEHPGSYLSRVVLNGCRDHSRDRGSKGRLTQRIEHSERGGDPETEFLWDVLNELPFNHRAAVVLRFYGGFTENEIAELLDCRPGSVGPWISRALTQLERKLR